MENWLYASMDELIDMDYKDNKMIGRVKWFNNRKGFGFITNENEEEIFVHYSDIVSDKNWKTLDKNNKVTFEIVECDGRAQAKNVQKINDN